MKYVLSFLIVCVSTPLFSSEEKIAIIGDAYSLGAYTNPNIAFDNERIYKLMTGDGLKSSVVKPTKLWPSVSEYSGGMDWVSKHILEALFSYYMNSEENSWGAFLSKELNIPSNNVLLTGQNWSGISSLTNQVDRILHYNGKLPSRIFIMFSGYDLCGARPELIMSSDMYEVSLRRGLKYIESKAQEQGSYVNVFVLGYMDMMQLFVSEKLLKKEVYAHGKTISCQKLRENQFLPDAPVLSTKPQKKAEVSIISQTFPPNPSRFCPSLFGEKEEKSDSLSIFANHIRSFRRSSKEVIEKISADAVKNSNVRFKYISATEKIRFEAEDIAEDCIHLSIEGQKKLSKTILENLE